MVRNGHSIDHPSQLRSESTTDAIAVATLDAPERNNIGANQGRPVVKGSEENNGYESSNFSATNFGATSVMFAAIATMSFVAFKRGNARIPCQVCIPWRTATERPSARDTVRTRCTVVGSIGFVPNNDDEYCGEFIDFGRYSLILFARRNRRFVLEANCICRPFHALL